MKGKKEFYISRPFKVPSRRIISAWSPLATGIMSELWCHPACCEGFRFEKSSLSLLVLQNLTRINQRVGRCLGRKLDTPRRAGQGSSIARFRAEKRVESFPAFRREHGKGIGHNDNTGFHFNGRNRWVLWICMQEQQPSVTCQTPLWQKDRSRCSRCIAIEWVIWFLFRDSSLPLNLYAFACRQI